MASRLAQVGIMPRPVSYSRTRPGCAHESPQRIAAGNPMIELYVLRGVGHQFGARQAGGLQCAATWLADRLND
jgi:hypothetical protein